MKFNGDPLGYTEFKTNLRDNIESGVSDESHKLTWLLAQCTGKAKEQSDVALTYRRVKGMQKHVEPSRRTLASLM